MRNLLEIYESFLLDGVSCLYFDAYLLGAITQDRPGRTSYAYCIGTLKFAHFLVHIRLLNNTIYRPPLYYICVADLK